MTLPSFSSSRQADNDFAAILLRASNIIEQCHLESRALKGPGLPAKGYNNKAAQLNQVHRVMHYRSHQANY